MKKTLWILAISWALVIVDSVNAMAQCAMCKASVEANVNIDGIGFASKLNFGIMYLFVTPYLLAMIIGFLWYRKSKEHKRKLEKA